MLLGWVLVLLPEAWALWVDKVCAGDTAHEVAGVNEDVFEHNKIVLEYYERNHADSFRYAAVGYLKVWNLNPWQEIQEEKQNRAS